jgi:hypothetical protein
MGQSSLSKKLLIKSDQTIAIVNAPPGFMELLLPLPEGVKVTKSLRAELEFVLMFVKTVVELEKLGKEAAKAVAYDAKFWVAYPKKSSKMKSDITRDVGWSSLEKAGFEGVAQIAIDETWSASRLRPKELVKSRK